MAAGAGVVRGGSEGDHEKGGDGASAGGEGGGGEGEMERGGGAEGGREGLLSSPMHLRTAGVCVRPGGGAGVPRIEEGTEGAACQPRSLSRMPAAFPEPHARPMYCVGM